MTGNGIRLEGGMASMKQHSIDLSRDFHGTHLPPGVHASGVLAMMRKLLLDTKRWWAKEVEDGT